MNMSRRPQKTVGTSARTGVLRGSAPLAMARGFTLVEALVSLLILSVGMLGIAGLFLESVRSSRTALLRTQAVNLVADMADRIRANTSAREAYDSGSYAADPAPHDCAPSNVSAGGNCTLQELAEDDLARWTAAVRNALPTADGAPPAATVEFFPGANSNSTDRYRITVSWREPGEAQPYSYRSEVIIMRRNPA